MDPCRCKYLWYKGNTNIPWRNEQGEKIMLKGNQKKIDVAKPFGKINEKDFAKLRANKNVGGMVKDKRSPFMGGGIAYAGGGRTMKRKGGKV